MKTNYHTHTERCGHAKLGASDEDYVKAAIEGGFTVLGFSDHTPWPYVKGFESSIRMHRDELEGYVSSIESLREKYADDIEIKIGLECEYYPASIDWLKLQKIIYNLDYLILGNHYIYNEYNGLSAVSAFTNEELKLYMESSIKAMETGLYDCFAHPELFIYGFKQPTQYCIDIFRELAIAAKELDVVFERNIHTPFHLALWQVVAEIQPKVILGVDAHSPDALLYTQTYDDNLRVLDMMLGIKPISHL